tara:strand:- start:2585 stop:3601 length:1017 start_codon:yes stop_codon:yes gene_type:complete
MNVLVTGIAGFIGFHLSKTLMDYDVNVIGIDNLNNYYDIDLKYSRLKLLGINFDENKNKEKFCYSDSYGNKIKFYHTGIDELNSIDEIFKDNEIDVVCNLAAQAGVRYSIENPAEYIKTNIVGYYNVIESSKKYKVKKFIYASSSSVYGNSDEVPYNELQQIDKPISLYAATKKSNELIAYSYSSLYSLNTIGLRFFTVYGPWGRPDMAYFKFVKNILEDKPIQIYNNGDLSRDFTYIDDIIRGLVKVIFKENDLENNYSVFNIGNNSPVNLLEFVEVIESILNKKAKKVFMPMQPGDVNITWANIDSFVNEFKYKPTTEILNGLNSFINWYKDFYNK